jgi:hypothetical protein
MVSSSDHAAPLAASAPGTEPTSGSRHPASIQEIDGDGATTTVVVVDVEGGPRWKLTAVEEPGQPTYALLETFYDQ